MYDRVVRGGDIEQGAVEIDATGRIVTPGFALKPRRPSISNDLPCGAGALRVTYSNGEPTGELPARLVRGARFAATAEPAA